MDKQDGTILQIVVRMKFENLTCDRFAGIPCCEHSPSQECREKCHGALQNQTVEENIIDEVSKYCGLPNPSVS